MKKIDAIAVLKECDGRSYTWLSFYGLDTIKESINTILTRKSSTKDEVQLAYKISYKIYTKG